MKKIALSLLLVATVAAGFLFKKTTSTQQLSVQNQTNTQEAAIHVANATKDSSPSKSANDSALAEIQAVNECYSSQTCDFSQEDPRSYEFAVGKKLAALIKSYREQKNVDPSTLESLAKQYIQSQDGFVQEEALHAFSQLPPSRENLASIFQGIQSTPDPLLIEQAMKEFQRYMGSNDEAAIQEFLSQFLTNGAHYSSARASELILPFINEQSYPLFQSALKGLAPTTIVAGHLKTALQEYNRMQRGG